MIAETEMMPLKTITQAGFRRFTVVEYHRLIASGHLTPEDRIELLEGHLVNKMARNPPHDAAINMLMRALLSVIGPDWDLRMQCAVSLGASEPEPDAAIVRMRPNQYADRHPEPADLGLVVEVAESSLALDRIDKLRIYARHAIPTYWIVNLVDRQIEVYDRPTGPSANPEYATRQTYVAGDSVPVILDGQPIGQIPVNSLLPLV
ncbi:Uma2 family endonuclease [Zavarzinella formosa]|uniref:Uma2 family endonuclease n=1 Tax=Zavarzinella formosa TaxID=360055 RepID=UPI0002E3A163|nr:Uma2 family endonuclease [Zavarzinella formosa]